MLTVSTFALALLITLIILLYNTTGYQDVKYDEFDFVNEVGYYVECWEEKPNNSRIQDSRYICEWNDEREEIDYETFRILRMLKGED